jgi:hypothetical protein
MYIFPHLTMREIIFYDFPFIGNDFTIWWITTEIRLICQRYTTIARLEIAIYIRQLGRSSPDVSNNLYLVILPSL